MSYEVVQQGVSGLGGLGAVFGPDCWTAKGNPDVVGRPHTPAEAGGVIAKLGLERGTRVVQICNQSSSPLTCSGQVMFAAPYLGRPCQPDWKAWVAQKEQEMLGGGVAPPVYAPAVEEDNTMLYAGVAAVAVLGVAGVYLATKKKR